jgi:hypothetical protein
LHSAQFSVAEVFLVAKAGEVVVRQSLVPAKPVRPKKRTSAEQGWLVASNPNRETPSPVATHFAKLQHFQMNQR